MICIVPVYDFTDVENLPHILKNLDQALRWPTQDIHDGAYVIVGHTISIRNNSSDSNPDSRSANFNILWIGVLCGDPNREI